jgi:alpha-1,3-rhamnosyl/mannosyltransferase
MRMRCPVITSNGSATAEVAGGAALLVSPHNPDELTSAMARISEEASLRARLKETGHDRARLFTWSACAEKTLSIYKSLLA